MVNATSTLLPSMATLSDFKLSIQAPKTFIVTPTAFSGTVSPPRFTCHEACPQLLSLESSINIATSQVLHAGEVNALVQNWLLGVQGQPTVADPVWPFV